MTRLFEPIPSTAQGRLPASLVAMGYNSALPGDRNDIMQFERLGDRNDKRSYRAMHAHALWCRLLARFSSSGNWTCLIPASLH